MSSRWKSSSILQQMLKKTARTEDPAYPFSPPAFKKCNDYHYH